MFGCVWREGSPGVGVERRSIAVALSTASNADERRTRISRKTRMDVGSDEEQQLLSARAYPEFCV